MTKNPIKIDKNILATRIGDYERKNYEPLRL